MRLTRARLLLATVALLQLVALVHWVASFGSQFGEDFDTHWAAAQLLATGHGAQMYALPAQLHAVHAGGVTGLTFLNHAGWGPVALATVLPTTLLPLAAAIALWTLLQLAALAAAAVLAVRSTRLPEGGDRWLAVLGLLVAPGLAALVALGQWEGFAALLVVLFWRDAGAGRRTRCALWLLLLAGAVPQVALGLAAFQLGLWGWRQLGTLAAGGALLGGASLLLLGPSGDAAWIGQVLDLAREVEPRDTDGLNSLAAAVAGRGTLATGISLLASAAALAACWALARRARAAASDRPALLPSLALAVTTLSLLASPHLFDYTLIAMAPLAAAALMRSRSAAMLLLWTFLGFAPVAALHTDHVWWRPAVPLALLAIAAAAAAPDAPRVRRLRYAMRG